MAYCSCLTLGMLVKPGCDANPSYTPDGGEDGGLNQDAGQEETAPNDGSQTADPSVDGPLGVDEFTVQVAIQDQDGSSRNVNVVVYVPADKSLRPFPVVVFSHGFNMNGSNYVSFGRRLASHGLVALLPSWGDSMMSPRTHVQLAHDVMKLNDWIEAQAGDSGSALYGIVDMVKVAAGGHSRGGKQSIFAAILDPRIKASFNVDPVDSAPPYGSYDPADYPSVTPEMMSQFLVPSGFVGGGYSGEATLGTPCAPAEDNYHQYFIAAPGPAYEYLILKAGHMDFVDDCGFFCFACKEGDDRDWNRNLAKTTMVAFYKLVFQNDQRYRSWLDGAAINGMADRVTFDQH